MMFDVLSLSDIVINTHLEGPLSLSSWPIYFNNDIIFRLVCLCHIFGLMFSLYHISPNFVKITSKKYVVFNEYWKG